MRESDQVLQGMVDLGLIGAALTLVPTTFAVEQNIANVQSCLGREDKP